MTVSAMRERNNGAKQEEDQQNRDIAPAHVHALTGTSLNASPVRA